MSSTRRCRSSGARMLPSSCLRPTTSPWCSCVRRSRRNACSAPSFSSRTARAASSRLPSASCARRSSARASARACSAASRSTRTLSACCISSRTPTTRRPASSSGTASRSSPTTEWRSIASTGASRTTLARSCASACSTPMASPSTAPSTHASCRRTAGGSSPQGQARMAAWAMALVAAAMAPLGGMRPALDPGRPLCPAGDLEARGQARRHLATQMAGSLHRASLASRNACVRVTSEDGRRV
mmetsp:Transcript_6937/g.17984  ORF Transcript_6937/g.17984 Transcript_6937/m.17984 type:complete len:243 (+) Transcript_6937:989-1717(+)